MSAIPSSIPSSQTEVEPDDGAQREPGDGAERMEEGRAQLLNADEREAMSTRWRELQTVFVDDPRQAVDGASQLVTDLMEGLARGLADDRERLHAVEGNGDQASTEELRWALQRYRSVFERLLSV